jgi:hypothetical protein
MSALRLNLSKLGEYLPLVTQDVVHRAKIPLLPLREQERIVKYHQEIDLQWSTVRHRAAQSKTFYQSLIDQYVAEL